MSEITDVAVQQGQTEDIACLMVPLTERTLLIPTVTIAEMVPYRTPVAIENAPDWLLGFIEWRNQKVPLLSFEVLNGEAKAEVTSRSQLAVFNNTGVSDEVPFVAIPTAGIPKLARVAHDDLGEELEVVSNFERVRADMNGETIVIPNVTALEQAYSDWTG